MRRRLGLLALVLTACASTSSGKGAQGEAPSPAAQALEACMQKPEPRSCGAAREACEAQSSIRDCGRAMGRGVYGDRFIDPTTQRPWLVSKDFQACEVDAECQWAPAYPHVPNAPSCALVVVSKAQLRGYADAVGSERPATLEEDEGEREPCGARPPFCEAKRCTAWEDLSPAQRQARASR